MNARGNARLRAQGQPPQPLDHLPPGGQQPADPNAGDAPTSQADPANPADSTGVGVQGEAVRGKATRSPADVATRPHLEGSEQGPQ